MVRSFIVILFKCMLSMSHCTLLLPQSLALFIYVIHDITMMNEEVICCNEEEVWLSFLYTCVLLSLCSPAFWRSLLPSHVQISLSIHCSSELYIVAACLQTKLL